MTPRTATAEPSTEAHQDLSQSQSEAESQPEAQANPPLGPGHPNRPLTYGQFMEGVTAILAAQPELPEVVTLEATEDPGRNMIYGQMAKVLRDMPAVPKAQRNSSQGFNFQGVDDILDNLNPTLGQHGVFFVPVVEERVTEIRQTKNAGTLWTVHLRVRYTFYAEDGSSVESVTWGEGTDSGDKATSKAMTMAMKSMLRQVFAISDNEDPDATTQESDPVPDRVLLSDEDRQELQDEIDKLTPKAQTKLKELWVAQKGALPSLKNASEEHVPAIVALIAAAADLAEQDDLVAEAEAEAVRAETE